MPRTRPEQTLNRLKTQKHASLPLTRLLLCDGDGLLHFVQVRDADGGVEPPLEHLSELEELEAAGGDFA